MKYIREKIFLRTGVEWSNSRMEGENIGHLWQWDGWSYVERIIMVINIFVRIELGDVIGRMWR